MKKYWYSQQYDFSPDFPYMTVEYYIGNNPISFLHLVYIICIFQISKGTKKSINIYLIDVCIYYAYFNQIHLIWVSCYLIKKYSFATRKMFDLDFLKKQNV